MKNSLDIIKAQKFEDIEQLFKGAKNSDFAEIQQKALKQFKVEEHDVLNKQIRKDKTIKKDISKSGSEGATNDSYGNPKTQTVIVPVNRIAENYQELIVGRRVGFMLSDPVVTEPIYAGKQATEPEERLEKLVEKIQNDNKIDYKNKEIARRLMSELEVAELWYLALSGEAKPKYTLKLKILSPDLGDTLYPLYDKTGDMIAFGRGYKIKEDDKEVEHFDVYTAEFEYKYVNRNNKWDLDTEVESMTIEGAKKVNPIPNSVQKIMVIYHSQPKPEWDNVQTMIDRDEELMSNHADMNDYFGSPIMTIEGNVLGFAQKGEQGKILQLEKDARANYLALNSPPESIKMELENLNKKIYSNSQTPDISFEQMTKIGGDISGIALRLLFLDAHMAVKCKEEIFGIGLQRRLNLIKAAIGAVIDTSLSGVAKTLQLKPKITPYLPQNVKEMIDNLTVSRSQGIISTQTAIELNPLVEDSEEEINRVQNDKTEELAGNEGIIDKNKQQKVNE